MLLIFLCISVGTGVYTMISLFRNNAQGLVQACLDANPAADQGVCQTTAKITEAIIIVIYVVVWLLQLCEPPPLIMSVLPLNSSRGLRDRYQLLSSTGRRRGGIAQVKDGRTRFHVRKANNDIRFIWTWCPTIWPEDWYFHSLPRHETAES